MHGMHIKPFFDVAEADKIWHTNGVAMKILPSNVNLESSLSTLNGRPAVAGRSDIQR
jgi:hypothetical protein